MVWAYGKHVLFVFVHFGYSTSLSFHFFPTFYQLSTLHIVLSYNLSLRMSRFALEVEPSDTVDNVEAKIQERDIV